MQHVGHNLLEMGQNPLNGWRVKVQLRVRELYGELLARLDGQRKRITSTLNQIETEFDRFLRVRGRYADIRHAFKYQKMIKDLCSGWNLAPRLNLCQRAVLIFQRFLLMILNLFEPRA